MKLKSLQATFRNELQSLYSKEEIDSFYYILLDKFFNVKRLDLALNHDKDIENAKPIFDALHLLKQQKPIQYIIGETEFYGLPFTVNNHVLIPRPETEELVEWILRCCLKPSESTKALKILDIGTGSGCIAIALAKHVPNAQVYAIDVSTKALTVAKQNAELNNVDVNFIHADILNWNSKALNFKFDVIVSNPPYVRVLEKQLMKPNVLNNEPHLALFVEDNNPLVFYNAISALAPQMLNENGMLFFEINEYLGEDVLKLLNSSKFKNTELRKDIFGKDRMVKADINL